MDDAVVALAQQHGQRLLGLAHVLTGGQAQEAEDIVQTVWLRLLTRGLDGIEDPFAYAHRAVINEFRTRASAGRRHRELDRMTSPYPMAAPHDADRVENRDAIARALQVLSPRERCVIVLRYLDDMPDDQIASILGCRSASVRSLAHRAMPKLRAILDTTQQGETEAVDTHESGAHA